jgi:signal recognition particle subunit SRP54
MTPAERHDPKILNATRRTRIARGSGTQVSDVNSLVERFGEAQKMMRGMRGGKGGAPGMPGMPGMGGMPFGGGGGKKSKGRSGKAPVKGKKSRSGNPAKRAVQESANPAPLAGANGDASAVEPTHFDPASFELPDDVKKLLGP